MKFLLSSTHDFQGVENLNNFQIIEPCKFVQYPWHADRNGCFLLQDKCSNELYHVFRHQDVHFDSEGLCVPEAIRECDLEYDYCFKRYFHKEPVPEKCVTVTEKDESVNLSMTVCLPEDVAPKTQRCRFSVNLGPDISDTFGAFNVEVFGSKTYLHLQNLMQTYMETILPVLNDKQRLSWPWLETNTVNHLLPEQLFDIVIKGGRCVFLRPCSIVNEWRLFLDGLRTQILGVIRKLAESTHPDVSHIFETRDKLREKKVCSSSTFASSRHIVNEFRCPSKTMAECPHIRLQTSKEGKLELNAEAHLCHFLLCAYLDQYDEAVVNLTFGFKCHFTQSLPVSDVKCYNRAIDHTQNNIAVFQALFGRQVMLHRICLPSRYLSIDWFRFVLKLLELERTLE